MQIRIRWFCLRWTLKKPANQNSTLFHLNYVSFVMKLRHWTGWRSEAEITFTKNISVMLPLNVLITSINIRYTPIHESSAFQIFIFHIYILSFSFLLSFRTHIAHLEKVKSIMSACVHLNLLHNIRYIILSTCNKLPAALLQKHHTAHSLYKSLWMVAKKIDTAGYWFTNHNDITITDIHRVYIFYKTLNGSYNLFVLVVQIHQVSNQIYTTVDRQLHEIQSFFASLTKNIHIHPRLIYASF